MAAVTAREQAGATGPDARRASRSTTPREGQTMTTSLTDDTRDDIPDDTPPTLRRRAGRFALWGVPAGILGFAGAAAPRVHWEEGVTNTVADLEALTSGGFHRSIVLGLAATFCLAMLAAGWRRWAENRAPDSLAGRLVGIGMTAAVGAMILGYGFYGSLAVYLPGGMDFPSYDLEGLWAVYLFVDFAPFIAWWGVTFAVAGMAHLALREKVLPRWLGVLAVPFLLAPVGFLAATGLPGFPGVVTPLFLVISGVALARSTRV
ncbi:hypothetical protein FTX61_08180 [Nitriliruptoraceae bacterium ZYF776]|nr:hypothetical protein [Profundirhabdus halotolerans]